MLEYEVMGYLTGNAVSLMEMTEALDISSIHTWTHMKIDRKRVGRVRRYDAGVLREALVTANSITVWAGKPDEDVTAVPSVSFVRASALGPVVNIAIKWPIGRYQEALAVSDLVAASCPVQSGFLHPHNDFRYQNEMSPLVLRWVGIEPKRIFWSERVQANVADLELNPCHNHRWGALNFTSAWTLYLGPEYLRLVNPAPALALCWGSTQAGDVLRMTLFEDPASAQEPASVSILWSVRDALAFEGLAHQLAPLG